MRRIVAALALLVAMGAGAPIATGGRFGATLGPSPFIIEDWPAPAVYLLNAGDVPIGAVLTIAGDGYALGPATFAAIPPGATVTAPLAAIGAGSALITATVTNSKRGTDRNAIVLQSKVRHLTALERLGATLSDWLPLAAAGFLLLAVLGVLAVRRRPRRPTA